MEVPAFSGAIMAGGKSRRMGQEKGLLQVSWRNKLVPLWRRQHQLLDSLDLKEVFISDDSKPYYPQDLPVIADRWREKGPLAGIAACLNRCETDLLLVVAIDLPKLEADLLRRLMAICTVSQGTVPKWSGHFEPLVAVYPRGALEQAETLLSRNEVKLQDFVGRLEEKSLIVPYQVRTEEAGNFENWNAPQDLYLS